MWNRWILGVDVGSTSIKVAQAEETPFGKRILCRLAICNDMESLAELLEHKAWWKPGDRVHLGFSSDQVVLRNLKLPFQRPSEIRQILPFELEGEIPFPVEEIVASYLVREWGKEGSELLALASTQQAVSAYLDRFRPLDLDPVILEPDITALAHIVPGATPDPPQTLGILDMGATKTNFLLVHENRVHSARCVRRGLGPSEVAVPLPTTIMQEIDLIFKTLRSQGEAPWLEVLYLSGGVSDIPEVTAWLEARWGIPVQLLSPLNAIPCALAEGPDTHPARFSTAIGLTLSREKHNTCNLRVGSFAYRPSLSMLRGRTVTAGILFLLAVVIGLGDLYAHLVTRQRNLEALKEESHALFREAFPQVTQIVDPALQMQRHLEEQKARQFNLLAQDPRGTSVEILREISLRVQASTHLRLIEFDLNGDVISLRGEADRYDTIEKAKDRWQESPLLDEVEIKTAKKNRKTQLWEFQCVARRKYT